MFGSREGERTSLLVRGGTIVGSGGRFAGDVLIVGDRIAAVAAPEVLDGAAASVLDASGLLVLPGLIDAHVHLRDPGLVHKEDFESGTRAAAAGGVTTVLVMPYDNPIAATAAALVGNARYGEGRAYVDYGLQGAAGPANVEAIPELAAAGAVSLEVMLAEAPVAVGAPSPWELRAILERARASDVVVGVYCEDPSIAAGAKQALLGAGRRDPAAHVESKPPIGERLGVQLVCTLAAEVSAAVHLRQISTAGALRVARQARASGADVTVEVTPHHLSLTAEVEAHGGPDLKVSPPLRDAADVDALRQGVASGQVDVVATDHAPHAASEKAAGRADIWAAPGGFPGLETLLSVLLQVFGDVAPELIARVCAESPAHRFGLAHRKGRIAPGLDADLVLLDPTATWRVDPARLHTRAGFSPYAGAALPGVVRSTLLRGEIVAREREIVAEPRGQWLRRGLARRAHTGRGAG